MFQAELLRGENLGCHGLHGGFQVPEQIRALVEEGHLGVNEGEHLKIQTTAEVSHEVSCTLKLSSQQQMLLMLRRIFGHQYGTTDVVIANTFFCIRYIDLTLHVQRH